MDQELGMNQDETDKRMDQELDMNQDRDQLRSSTGWTMILINLTLESP
ncbi:hypothetical protein [Sphingobacterium sp. NPDC055346]